ncbi:MAG: hypothetical protein M0P12_12130 [Paludibacteraceae bacterium]|nr:hypothetical protein [Paludibacteraceae bacterium]
MNNSIVKRYLWLFMPLFLLSMTSCSEEEETKEYNINAELDPYLQKFLYEASLRGKSYDLKGDGLIMEFANLERPTVGLCIYEDPIRIQIDRTYWMETLGSANAENLREDVVFHELSHGLLKRQHDNRTLPNTEWKSIMCGGSDVDGRDWSVNFNGARKKYYLDELFAINVPAPDYAQRTNFDKEVGISQYDKAYNFPKEDTNTLLKMDSIPSVDFQIEAVMKVTMSTSQGITGLFVSSKDATSGANYFALGMDERVNLLNTECISPFAEVLVNELYNAEDYNKFTLRKEKDNLFFYINDVLVYWNDYALKSYDYIGVILPKDGTVILKSFKYYNNSNLKSASGSFEPKALPLIQKKPSVYNLSK